MTVIELMQKLESLDADMEIVISGHGDNITISEKTYSSSTKLINDYPAIYNDEIRVIALTTTHDQRRPNDDRKHYRYKQNKT